TSELGPVSSRLLLLEFLEMVVGNYRFVVEKDWYATFVVEVGIVERAIAWKIGEDGFGSVYRGVIKSFEHPFDDIQARAEPEFQLREADNA
ncbi:hypothetical protein Tco_0057183, partial [Tanacetum coccineum]